MAIDNCVDKQIMIHSYNEILCKNENEPTNHEAGATDKNMDEFQEKKREGKKQAIIKKHEVWLHLYKIQKE